MNLLHLSEARWFSAIQVDGPSEGQAEESMFVAQEIAKQFSKVTIAVDGVFFDDGTFVGPDTTGFFIQ